MTSRPLSTLLLGAAVGVLAACSAQAPAPAAPRVEEIATTAPPPAPPAGPVPASPANEPADAAAVSGPQADSGADAQVAGEALAQATSAPSHAPRAKLGATQAAAVICCAPPAVPAEGDVYHHFESSPVQVAAEQPVSTFSIDVDTGSYALVRRWLGEGRLPPQDAVRVEELINYFDYGYAPPRDRAVPFSISTEMTPTPWNARTHLLRIGLQGWKPHGPRVPSNLVFLVDVSGSMQDANKLPLVKEALKMLARQSTPEDRISLVVYAGASGVVLEPTRGDDVQAIESALGRLEAGGSTNGGDGIRLAYAMAQKSFRPGANNRVLLATDGDFNVGTTSFAALVDLVEEKRKTGVALTTLGFGEGNYNDRLMEQLADAGDGNYAYIDGIDEARKVLVEQREATLTTIARDVKIQVEFNPAVVSEYRLIGYENRALKREDFANDKVDAGDIGAGHTVTALYEVALAGEGGERVEPLRYGRAAAPSSGKAAELAFLRLRYKEPGEGVHAASKLIEQPIAQRDTASRIGDASRGMRLAVAVAGFGQLLRRSAYTADFQYTDVERLARSARSENPRSYETGFETLVAQARELSSRQSRVELED